MSKPIRLAIFDCDGVLVDSERIAVRVDVVVLAELGWVMTEAEVVEHFMGRTDEYLVSQIEAHLGRPLPANWEEPFQRLYREAFEGGSNPSPVFSKLSMRSPLRPALRRVVPTREFAIRWGSPDSIHASLAESLASVTSPGASRPRITFFTRRIARGLTHPSVLSSKIVAMESKPHALRECARSGLPGG